jgi:hypothetical protein
MYLKNMKNPHSSDIKRKMFTHASYILLGLHINRKKNGEKDIVACEV